MSLISKVKQRKLDTFWVIHMPTMSTLEIEAQFQSMAENLGIWDFLIAFRECEAYEDATHEFLSTFYFSRRVTFKLLSIGYRYTLEHFNEVLDFPTDGGHQYDNNLIKDTPPSSTFTEPSPTPYSHETRLRP